MSIVERLKNLKAGESLTLEGYTSTTQVSASIARARAAMGYRFTAKRTKFPPSVVVTRLATPAQKFTADITDLF